MNTFGYSKPENSYIKFKIVCGIQVYINEEDGNFYTIHPKFICTTFKEISNLLKNFHEQKTSKTDLNIIIKTKINGDNNYVVGKLYEIEYTDNEVLIVRFKYNKFNVQGYLNPNRKTANDFYLVQHIKDIDIKDIDSDLKHIDNIKDIDSDLKRIDKIEILLYTNSMIDSICEKLNKNSIERIDLNKKYIENIQQYDNYINLSKSFQDFIYIKN